MATYKTLAALLTDLTDNNAGLITAFTDQNVLVSAADTLCGLESVRQQYGLTGTNSTTDWNALSNALNSSSKASWPRGFNPQLNTSGKTLTQEVLWEGVSMPLPNTGTPSGLNANSAGSGAIIFTPGAQALVWRNLEFSNGKVWCDLGNGVTVEVPLIWIENCWGASISCLLRDGSIANGLTRKLDKLIFRNNYLNNNDRGLFLNGNGASRAWVQNNHVTAATRFGLMVACATPQPQTDGKNDFVWITHNLVEGLTYSGANSNPIYMAGRYGICMGNIVADSNVTGDPAQSNYEGMYYKMGVTSIVGNIVKNGGNQQGMWALKGGGRSNNDNGPGGWAYAFTGNVGTLTSDYTFNQPSLWIQADDCNIGNNVWDSCAGSAHVNKGLTGTDPTYNPQTGGQLGHTANILFHDNLYTHVRFGGMFIAEGGQLNVQCVGNTLHGCGGSGQSFGVRFDSQSLGNMQNYRCEQNTMWGFTVTAAARCDCIHIKPAAPDAVQGLTILNNVIDLLGNPDNTNVFGITFDGGGPVNDCVIDGNQFRNFPDPTKVIRGTGGNTGTVLIKDNIGFTNDNRGTGTIVVGQASVTINHGMPQAPHLDPTPDATDITIVPTTFLFGATQARITNRTATTFDVVLDAAVATSDWTFSWRCRKTKWSFT